MQIFETIPKPARGPAAAIGYWTWTAEAILLQHTVFVEWIFLTLWGRSLPLHRQTLSAAARAHWPHLWANKHVNLRQRQYLTSSCIRGSERGRMCLWSKMCMNLSSWQNAVDLNPASLVSITYIFLNKRMNIGTVLQEDEFRNALSFIRGKESRCALHRRRTRLFLSVLRVKSARDLALRTRPGLLMHRKYNLLEWAYLDRNQWLPRKHSQVFYRLV